MAWGATLSNCCSFTLAAREEGGDKNSETQGLLKKVNFTESVTMVSEPKLGYYGI